MPQNFFGTYPSWDPDKHGTDTWCMQKMYRLLFQVNSPFSILDKLYFVEHYGGVQASFDCFKFEHKKKGEIFLYYPDDGLTAYYRKSKSDPQIDIRKTSFDQCFEMLANTVKDNPFKDKRFIFPIFETGFKGYGHVVTMVIDYDSNSKTIKPVIYDSIGRGTVSDFLASFVKRKYESTADFTLKRYMDKKFNCKPQLQRIGYDHQNRRSNWHCGLFAFRIIHHAITDFLEKGIGILSIPKSINIDDTDTHFLTSMHIKSIKQCINEDVYTFNEFLNLLSNMKQDLPLNIKSNIEFPCLSSSVNQGMFSYR